MVALKALDAPGALVVEEEEEEEEEDDDDATVNQCTHAHILSSAAPHSTYTP